MNKYAFNQGMPYCWLPPKILLIMKLIIVMMTTCLMQVTAATFAQKLTYSKKGVSLEEIFKEIKKQTGYNVLYSPEKVDDTKKIDVYFKETTLPEVLEKVVSGQALEYTIDDKNISLKPKESTFLERLANRWASIDASGRVVDSENRPLPGASVKVKKTGKGVSTDKDGKFFLRGVEEGAVLVVSFIGYLSKEVSASANMGNVVLEQSLSKLDEIQVIAYGTTTQRLSTGNVTTIKADVIEKQPVNNPLLALQGRVPGLFIEQATGFAGTGVKVRIQGQNSLNNGSDPLYVIDGVPFISQLQSGGNGIVGNSGVGGAEGNPFSFINPSDIESIDVLKDADATAIYGSRAANGAILITTKKGKFGDTRVNLNLQSGWGKVPRKLKLMNTEQYLEMRREALKNDGITDLTLGAYGDSDLNGVWDVNRNTDWQKELIGGTSGYQDMNASVSAGNERLIFLMGAGFHRETNVFPGHFADRKGSVHFNISNSSANQKFKVQFSGNYLMDDNQLPGVDLTSYSVRMAPNAPPLFTNDGTINWQQDELERSSFSNPVGYTKDKFQNKTNNLISNLILSYQIIEGLDLKGSFGYNNLSSVINNKRLLESVKPEYLLYYKRSTTITNSSLNSWSVEPQLSYRKRIDRGKLEILLGTTILQNINKGYSLSAIGFSNDLVMDDIMSAPIFRPLQSTSAVYKYNALFGRINYNWEDKYILNLTARRDGSSRFGQENQFHNFGAVGAAWIFSNENFIKTRLPFLSFGKLRGSYGTTGSDQIGDYQFLSLYNPVNWDIPYQGVPVYSANGLNNPYLKWEETRKFQVGMDLGFFNDRVILNGNYYENYSSNQLSGYNLPSTTGAFGITMNQPYKIKNSGYEVLLSTDNFQLKNFSWKTSINLTVPKSLLVDYPDIFKSSYASTAIIGKPLTAQTVFHFLGVDPTTGVYLFADKDGKATNSPDDAQDRMVIIDTAPKFYGGIQNSLNYRGFQLDFLFSFVRQVAQNYSFGGEFYPAGVFNYGSGNQLASLLNRWQKPGDMVSIQRYTTGSNLDQAFNNVYKSDAAWTDASYIRLKNVFISWSLPAKWAKGLRLQNGSLFVQGQNLWTITKYSGLDPETKSSISLPPLRVITVGLKVGL